MEKVTKNDEEWRQYLTPEQYEITRQKDTERPFSGKYCNWKENGIYRCIGCGNPLFSSENKYDSGINSSALQFANAEDKEDG